MTDLSLPIYNDPEAARQHMEKVRWPNGPVCPHCGCTDEAVHRLVGKKKTFRDGLYYCRECREQFTVTVGMICEHSHIPLHKWVLAFHLMGASKKGISSLQMQRMLGLGSYKSALFMTHRIRAAMDQMEQSGPLGGEGKVVEVDETYSGPPTYIYRGKKGWEKKTGSRQYKVVSMVERGGKARSVKVERINLKTIREVLTKHLSANSRLMTDEAPHYRTPGKAFVSHESVNHKQKEYARGHVSTNAVEGFFSIFKRGMIGTYQHCSEQHLHRYLAEFDFRFNHRAALGIDDDARAVAAIRAGEGKRLTYRRTDKDPEAEAWNNPR
jgi:transposase-like protein